MIVTRATLVAWRRALPRPIATAQGVVHERRGLRLTLRDDAGREAVGEAAPLPGFSVDTLAQARAALVSLTGADSPLAGRAIAGPDALAALLDALAWPPSAAHALDQALLGLLAQARGVPDWVLLGGAADAPPVASHRLVTDVAGARAAVREGVTVLKLKVGGATLEDDVARLTAVREAVGADLRLRVDANGAWPEATARAFLQRSMELALELLEEPVADRDLEAMARLRREFPAVAIAADESCRNAQELDAVVAASAADVVVVKPMLVGGPTRAAALARQAAAAGLGVMVTTSFDSEVAHAAALAVARACPAAARREGGLDPASSVCAAPVAGWALPDPLAAAARARPEHLAITVDGGEGLSWGALDREAGRCAAALMARGVVPGDLVALDGVASLAGVAALWGILRAGAAALPLGERSSAGEREAALAVAAPDHVVRAEELVAASAGLVPAPERDWPLEAVRVVILSGGTGGAPRPVALTAGQLAFGAFGSAMRLGHAPDDRWLVPLPLDHVGGLTVLVRTAFGASTALVQRRFSAVAVAAALDGGEATMASLVPEMLARVLDARPATPFPSTLRVLLIGGAPAPEALLVRCRAIGAPVALSWGMTETGAQIATRQPGDLAPGGGAGAPLATARVSCDEEGRLVVSGPIAPGGRFVTSDRGAIDARGRVQVQGRSDDVIISGGEKLDPVEVEAALLAHPAVAAALVAGVPDARWGARPVAALVARPGAERPDDEALHAWLDGRLARWKRPDRLLWREDLPRTALGKPSRAALCDLAQLSGDGGPDPADAGISRRTPPLSEGQ